jgi:hypothetical protein
VRTGALLLAGLVLFAGCTSDDPAPRSESTAEATTATTETSTTSTIPAGVATTPTTTGSAPQTTTSAGDESARITCWAAPPGSGSATISFSDATDDTNLVEPLTGMFGHAAAWGDVDADLTPDLVVGTFADRSTERYLHRGATEASPDRLLRHGGEPFVVDEGLPETYGRTSGSVLVDLDGDEDLDLVLSRNVKKDQPDMAPTEIYENAGGSFTAAAGGIDPSLGGRSVGVLDYDGDGLLDLFIVEDHYRGGSSRLYRNLDGLRFEDVTAAAGLPSSLAGLSVATSDVDADGDVDMFVAGDNLLFLDDGDTFTEAPSGVFAWPPVGNEDDIAGAAFGDVDRDGRPDLVVGQHFNSTVDHGTPAPVRLFVNRTEPGGPVEFEEAGETSGLIPLPTKAPHVEIVDFDNDGWPDVLTTASAESGTRPAVFRGLGLDDGMPRFEPPEGLGDPQYWVTGPTADVDHDGRLDLFLLEFEPSLPSYLLRNETASGNWLSVSVDPVLGAGVGARVFAYEAGGGEDPERLLGSADITVSRGYTAGIEAIAHLGLGDVESVDVVVDLPDGSTLTAGAVQANRHIRLPDGCG